MDKLKNKLLVGVGATLPSLTLAIPAFAAEGDVTAGTNPVVSAIESAVTSLTASSLPVIASAVSLGMVFFGAKLLWSKFKSMAK